jgi:raffinose/stachyose/melibiose transport system permease protein
MATPPASAAPSVPEAKSTLKGLDPRSSRRRKPRPKMERVNWTGTILLSLCALTVLVPLFVTISMSFKTGQQAVDPTGAFTLP